MEQNAIPSLGKDCARNALLPAPYYHYVHIPVTILIITSTSLCLMFCSPTCRRDIHCLVLVRCPLYSIFIVQYLLCSHLMHNVTCHLPHMAVPHAGGVLVVSFFESTIVHNNFGKALLFNVPCLTLILLVVSKVCTYHCSHLVCLILFSVPCLPSVAVSTHEAAWMHCRTRDL